MDQREIANFIYVVGPTGVGKSDRAIELAESYQFPIINCDSIQTYQKVNIGAAKPSQQDMARVPHHLFDYVSPLRKLTAADYVEDVNRLLVEKAGAEKHGKNLSDNNNLIIYLVHSPEGGYTLQNKKSSNDFHFGDIKIRFLLPLLQSKKGTFNESPEWIMESVSPDSTNFSLSPGWVIEMKSELSRFTKKS